MKRLIRNASLAYLTDIDVENRIRQDLGDVEGLAESIRDEGLMQPVVLEPTPGEKYKFRLLAGGRRYTAHTLLAANKVKSDDPGFFTLIPYVEVSSLTPAKRIKLELEENLRRVDMTWQERVIGIVEYHKAARRDALLEGDSWSQAQTGELLGLSQASVSVAFKLYDALRANNKAVVEAASMSDGLAALVSQQLDAANAVQMKRLQDQRAAAATKGLPNVVLPEITMAPPPPSGGEAPGLASNTHDDLLQVIPDSNDADFYQTAPAVQAANKITPAQVLSMYHHGSCLDLIPKLASVMPLHHFVCDPPFGINMDNLVMEGLDRIVDTHQVEENLKLLPEFLRVSFEHIQEDGFLCMWYDLDHHEKISTWATKIGWRVTRWPLIWCKTSPCRNSQAQYNITKSTEVCMFMRRSEKSIIKKKQPTNYVMASSIATKEHPFVKPEAVWNYCLDTVSSEGQNIVDGFAGNGSSLVASFKKRRNPVGIELDEKHIASALPWVAEQINTSTLDALVATL